MDDKSKVGGQDRDRVAGGEDYEVQYFATKHGLSPEQVRDLIKLHGNNRQALEDAATHMERDQKGKH